MSGTQHQKATGAKTQSPSAVRKGGGRKSLHRRRWPSAPDGFSMVIPASWKVPEARAAPTMPNRKRSERSLRARPATVGEITAATAELPSPLFRAGAPNALRGVTVGVYDVGIRDDLTALRLAICEALPNHVATTEVAVSGLTGLEVVRAEVPARDRDGLLYTMDVWVAVPRRPGHVAVLRFWHAGSSWDCEAAALEQAIADTFRFIVPGWFRGRFNRWVLRRARYFEPPDRADLSAPAEDGRRAAGWRLGVVFHTAQLDEKKLGFFTLFTGRPADELLGFAVGVAWIVFTFVFFARHSEGLGEWVYYGGSGPIGAWAQGLRRGDRSVVGLLAILAVTVGLGLLLG